MNEQSKEDLLKFKKEQLVEIIEMCHKANKYYLTKIDKAIIETKELYEMAKEQDSDNVNLIDRLEIILKTLRGKK